MTNSPTPGGALDATATANPYGVEAADPLQLVARARKFLGEGRPVLAYDLTAEALQRWPDHALLRATHALALVRAGVPGRANTILQALYDAGERTDEVVALLARTFKDLWEHATDPAHGRENLRRARELYDEAFRRDDSYWAGINCATLAAAAGDQAHARETARHVAGQCESRLAAGEADYWLLATLGEASLVLGETDAAAQWYTRALQAPDAALGSIGSTRRNALLLARCGVVDEAFVRQVLPGPKIAVFSGHMVDAPGLLPPRLPAGALADTYRRLKALLVAERVQVGYASAACGSDLLFLEALLELGKEIHVVLPFEAAEFRRVSVSRFGDDDWTQRFERVLARAATVTQTSADYIGDSSAFTYCNLVTYGLARSVAQSLGGELSGIAVWNGDPGAGGGTAETLASWRACGTAAWVLPPQPSPVYRLAALPAASRGQRWEIVQSGGQEKRSTELVTFLFADVVGFSKLGEKHIVPFVQSYLGVIAEVLRQHSAALLASNTWGDGLFFVFSSAAAGGQFALDMVARLAATDWAEKGLPPAINIRVGLHTGPAHRVQDPITGHVNFFGSHVSRAARIEPITPPGEVYASDAFAAACAADGVDQFACEYVGRTAFAKAFGVFPTYRVAARA